MLRNNQDSSYSFDLFFSDVLEECGSSSHLKASFDSPRTVVMVCVCMCVCCVRTEDPFFMHIRIKKEGNLSQRNKVWHSQCKSKELCVALKTIFSLNISEILFFIYNFPVS